MLLVANGLADVIENFQQLSFFLSNPPSVARLAPVTKPSRVPLLTDTSHRSEAASQAGT
jgi:hypothetical protein